MGHTYRKPNKKRLYSYCDIKNLNRAVQFIKEKYFTVSTCTAAVHIFQILTAVFLPLSVTYFYTLCAR